MRSEQAQQDPKQSAPFPRQSPWNTAGLCPEGSLQVNSKLPFWPTWSNLKGTKSSKISIITIFKNLRTLTLNKWREVILIYLVQPSVIHLNTPSRDSFCRMEMTRFWEDSDVSAQEVLPPKDLRTSNADFLGAWHVCQSLTISTALSHHVASFGICRFGSHSQCFFRDFSHAAMSR